METFKAIAKSAVKGLSKTLSEAIDVLFFSSLAGIGLTIGILCALGLFLG